MRRREGGRLGGIRAQPPPQLVALGQRRGVGALGHGQGPPDRVQPHQVGIHRSGVRGHGSERRDVRHRQARSGSDLRHAPRRKVTKGRAPRLELGTQSLGPGRVVGVRAAVGGADDEVALGAGGVMLQRAQQAADVGAPLHPGQDVGDAGVEPGQHRRGRSVRLRRLAVDKVADAFHGRAQRADPCLDVGLRRVDAQPGPQRRGERVGQPTGLGKRDGEGPRRRG